MISYDVVRYLYQITLAASVAAALWIGVFYP